MANDVYFIKNDDQEDDESLCRRFEEWRKRMKRA